ncbi:C40 family peptidase [Arthrobacter sp. Y-9]|uniref:C40 family peptidase n=1 Tax=Arthrobacter sp. Y-9 TaxID=3039385 RepID=UPI00241D069F|nr:C40 family peptidase [Arthrobacter sp. Y-9]WFR84411.1 C40 family peptidase [Arthrobacter sp. Y-9]
MAVAKRRKYAAILYSSALSASVLLGSGGIPGAVAAPLPASPVTIPADQSDSIPSESEIAAAKKNESSAKATQARLEGLIGTLADRQSSAITASMRANDAYTNALLTLKAKQDAAATAKAKAAAAQDQAAKSRKDLGTLASSIYKTGGVNPAVEGVLNGDGGDLLGRATTLDAISQKQSETFNKAIASGQANSALSADAAAAQKAADDAARDADQARAVAESAQTSATQALQSAPKDREKVIAQLASLRNTTVALETQRVQGLEQQRAAAALKALQDRAAQQPLPTPQPPAQGGNSGGNSGGGQPSQPQPPVVQPPVVQPPAPQPPAPRPPVVQPPAPQPPAPQPPAPQPPAPQPKPPVVTPPAPSPGGSAAQTAINFAMSKVGGPYVWGGNGPVGYDCSGLSSAAFAAAGVYMPRTATDQYFSAPRYIPMGQWQPGDLIFWGDGGSFYHVGIYIGGGQVVNALNPGSGITVSRIDWMIGMQLWPTAARYW